MKILVLYLFIINLAAVIVTIRDKYCAIKHKWRISELTLMLFSVIGGSVGMYITMLFIRHKTRRAKFMLGIPVIIVIQCVLFYYFWSCANG